MLLGNHGNSYGHNKLLISSFFGVLQIIVDNLAKSAFLLHMCYRPPSSDVAPFNLPSLYNYGSRQLFCPQNWSPIKFWCSFTWCIVADHMPELFTFTANMRGIRYTLLLFKFTQIRKRNTQHTLWHSYTSCKDIHIAVHDASGSKPASYLVLKTYELQVFQLLHCRGY